jgi:hypothetical protein
MDGGREDGSVVNVALSVQVVSGRAGLQLGAEKKDRTSF